MSKQLVRSSTRPIVPDAAALMPFYQEGLPLPVIRQLFKDTGHRFYQRILPPRLVMWGLIFQRLTPDHTGDACWSYLSRDAVRERLGLPPRAVEKLSESNSAYCHARKRLPWAVVPGILSVTARALQQAFGDSGLWHGACVNLLDGSTLQLPARPELTDHYGGASNQPGQSHWPLLRLVAGFDLFSGVANAVAEGP
jgi:hypothetical protein